jgi:hypothetical protein
LRSQRRLKLVSLKETFAARIEVANRARDTGNPAIAVLEVAFTRGFLRVFNVFRASLRDAILVFVFITAE